jgi:IclR family acetate operon transcriptional repressor
MGTVGKAMTLLEIFSAERTEVGLSELARIAGYDKATARRLLVSLMQHGLVEQDRESRFYRLGAGLVRLARIRESQFPLLQIAIPVLQRLAAETGETVHLSEYSARGLASIHVEESPKANRVSVAVGQMLPLHATASGLAFLAFAERRLRDKCLSAPLTAFTPHTVADPSLFAEQVATTRRRGYSIGSQGFEEGVFSVGAPILGPEGTALGALAIASPLVRIGPAEVEKFGAAAIEAAREISDRLGGRPSVLARKHAS